ncbi:MAG TPA: hypothetical protein VF797_13550, partial [Noviherbaspirillum sp.]
YSPAASSNNDSPGLREWIATDLAAIFKPGIYFRDQIPDDQSCIKQSDIRKQSLYPNVKRRALVPAAAGFLVKQTVT